MGFLIFAGVLAGVLTTLAGQGGGLFLLTVLSWRVGPHLALALSTPALLIANAHRTLDGRRDIVWPVARRALWAAVPCSVIGGLLAGLVPEWVIRVSLLGLAAFAFARAFGWVRARFTERSMPWAVGGVSVLTGTSGGAGILLAPVLLATGLSGAPYIATQSVIAVAMHGGRLLAYGSAGMLRDVDPLTLVIVTVAIVAGNVVAARARRFLPLRAVPWIEYGVLGVCTVVTVGGFRP
jgi:hypothetical protein